MQTLLPPELEERYARQLMLPGFGAEAQRRLAQSSVLLVGAGGLGSTLSQLLCAAGVGRLVLLDADRVSASNLQRQILYRTDQVGEPKAKQAAENLRRLNPHVQIEAYDEFLTPANARLRAEGCDLIADGSDNAVARYLMNDLCVGLGIPYVYGTIADFYGQTAVFNLTEKSATYRCLFPETETCRQATPPGVIGPLPALIASIQAQECIKILSGACGDPLDNRLLLWDMQTHATQKITLTPTEEGRKISLENFGRLPVA
ncbi:MAG: HesA/MoeB/ThiF family protein [Bacteroidales bacterium]|nr:HesA/MoeB/ThiF family protein [Bacteroidales bacterium]